MPEKLNPIRTRPRFKIFTDLEAETCAKQLKSQLKIENQIFQGNINKEVANIWVKTQHNEFWKPYLSLRIEKEEYQTVIRGILGPSSAVWTFFMFLYFIFSITFMVFITIWFVTKQIKSTDFPWAIHVAILSIILLLISFFCYKNWTNKGKI
ncbi:hypothetical protein [Chryseobacterium manosquense]|uniref:hypothetical protein n=1 Tax=Chryseobacterium manosquense TaxID=2754694 RepID=UPI001E4E491B|nr:hypothetical protein [Chryseobacterium manosquense]